MSVGYGSIKKRDVTGSVSSLTNKDFNDKPLIGSNEPLCVIDGVPIDGSDNNNSFNFSSLGGGSGHIKTSALVNFNIGNVNFDGAIVGLIFGN